MLLLLSFLIFNPLFRIFSVVKAPEVTANGIDGKSKITPRPLSKHRPSMQSNISVTKNDTKHTKNLNEREYKRTEQETNDKKIENADERVKENVDDSVGKDDKKTKNLIRKADDPMKKDKKERQKSPEQKTKLTEENIESATSHYSEPDEKGGKPQSVDTNTKLELSNRIKSASSGNDKTQETKPKKK